MVTVVCLSINTVSGEMDCLLLLLMGASMVASSAAAAPRRGSRSVVQTVGTTSLFSSSLKSTSSVGQRARNKQQGSMHRFSWCEQ
jgi:hypothetical protein